MTLAIDIRHRLGSLELDAKFETGSGLVALFGRSGSGKTSIVNIIAGLIRPDHRGSHWVLEGAKAGGEPPAPRGSRRNRSVQEDNAEWPRLSRSTRKRGVVSSAA